MTWKARNWSRPAKRRSLLNPAPPWAHLVWSGAVGLVLAFALGAAAAQESKPSSNEARARVRRVEFFEIESSETQDSANRRQRERAEDMEVMRRLVDRSIGALYASAKGCGECHSGMTDFWNANRADDSTFLCRALLDVTGTLPTPEVSRALAFLKSCGQTSAEGHSPALSTYLEGYGVVYQLEAPTPVEDAEAAEQPEASCPFLTHTPWQRAQLELRGQWRTEQCQACHSTASGEKTAEEANAIDQWRRRLAVNYLHRGAWHGREMMLLGIEPHGGSAGPLTRTKLVATLLDVLAENGHNVRHLAPEERVAVAITFRGQLHTPLRFLEEYWPRATHPDGEGADSEQNAQPPEGEQEGQADPDNSSSGAGEAPSAVGRGASFDPDAGGNAGMKYFPETRGNGTAFGDFDNDGDLDLLLSRPDGARLFRNRGDGRFEQAEGLGITWPDTIDGVSAFDYDSDGLLDLYVTQGQPTMQELTGDLYMRQRNYSAAIESYEKAIRDAMQGAPEGGAAAQRPLYNKLIQALVAANRFDKAKELIDLFGGREKPAPPQEQAHEAKNLKTPQLSPRLVVSATKAQLDAVHAGALSREEFANEATVQYVDPNVRGERGPLRDN